MTLHWIKSGGGPLICVEAELANSWLGVAGNSVSKDPGRVYASDYERACSVRDYLGKIALRNGDALILGDMPLETLIWHAPDKVPKIVRVYYGDPGADVIQALESAGDLDFDSPAEVLEIEVRSRSMVVFDSAYQGVDASIQRLSFDLSLGKYIVLTKQFLPNDRTSVLVHSFELVQ